MGDTLGVGLETDDGCRGVDALGGRDVWLLGASRTVKVPVAVRRQP